MTINKQKAKRWKNYIRLKTETELQESEINFLQNMSQFRFLTIFHPKYFLSYKMLYSAFKEVPFLFDIYLNFMPTL